MIVYKSRVFQVEETRVGFPDGHERDIAVVRHAPVVVLIPVPTPGQVILIRQYRASIARETWELPAGGIEHGEGEEQAARRECEEEISLVPHALERLGAWFPSPGFCDEADDLFSRVRSAAAAPRFDPTSRMRTRTSGPRCSRSRKRKRWPRAVRLWI